MFDPFHDFKENGYLRNNAQIKDAEKIKRIEHASFLISLSDALNYLISRKTILYTDFLKVHKILFGAFYPWAGQERSQTAPHIAISKSGVFFAHPLKEAQLSVEEGLRIAQDKNRFLKSPGTVLGYFAYGHPFLDGNGRTMWVVYSELARRAGFYIDLSKLDKDKYLKYLTQEIQNPGKNILDDYLLSFRELIPTNPQISLLSLIENQVVIKLS